MTQVRSLIELMEMIEPRCGTNKKGTDEIHRLMAEVRNIGKYGTLVVTFKVSPDKNDELALTISAKVKATLPEGEPRKALVYHDAESREFSRTDPRQLEMLAEQEAERQEREAELRQRGIERIGRGAELATATG